MSICDNIQKIKTELPPDITLVAVSKFHPAEAVREAYDAGQRVFGESRPQELKEKASTLPSDIEWHFIGHLQSNKIKYVVPYAALIHSVDSEALLFEIDEWCCRNGFSAQVLLEVHISGESTKQGFGPDEVLPLLERIQAGERKLRNVKIRGLMGMASFTDDKSVVNKEFGTLMNLYGNIREHSFGFLDSFDIRSFGMSGDYQEAIAAGATHVRIGTAIFGERDYSVVASGRKG